jgi:hypothetical protein
VDNVRAGIYPEQQILEWDVKKTTAYDPKMLITEERFKNEDREKSRNRETGGKDRQIGWQIGQTDSRTFVRTDR